MKKYIIILFSILFLINLVNAFYCYQESANINNQNGTDGYCSLNYTGKYDFSIYVYFQSAGVWSACNNRTNDGDWNTDCFIKDNNGYGYINYTIPANSNLNTSKWRVKDCWNGDLNYTLGDYNCSNTNGILQLRTWSFSDNVGFGYGVGEECYNTTNGWRIINHNSSYSDPSRCAIINEEAMLWSLPQLVYNNILFNNFTSSGAIETFTLNLTYDNLRYSGISVLLNYNNTNYSTNTTGLVSNKLFTSTIQIPQVLSITNKSFYFIVTLTNSTGSYNNYSSSNNQTISTFSIDDCTNNNNTLLNFTMYDEETLNKINGTIELQANIYSLNSNNLITSYSNLYSYKTNNQSRLCISRLNSSYNLNYNIRYYGNSSYYAKTKTIQSSIISNTSSIQQITLYNLLQTSGYPFSVIVVGNLLSSNGNANLLVEVQKQYIYLNNFYSVESAVTSSDGIAILHLVPNNEVYNFIVSYNGVVLGTFNNYKVTCSNPLACTITLNLASSTTDNTDFTDYGNISTNYNLDTSSNILYFTYNSLDGNSHNVSLNVVKSDGYGNTTICSGSSYGTSGTITCNIPISYQNTSFFTNLKSDGQYIGTKLFSRGTDMSSLDMYGVDIFIELLMYSSLVLLFIANPILIVIGAILGITCAIVLLGVTGGSFSTSIVSIAWFIGAGLIIIWQISKKI